MYVQLLTFYQYKHYLKHVCCVFVTQLHHGVAVFTGRTYTPHGVWPSRNWCIDTRVAMLVRYFTETWLDNLQHTLCFTDRCGVKIHLLLPTLWDLWFNVFNGSTVAIMCHNNSYYAFDSHARDHRGLPAPNGTAVLLQFGGDGVNKLMSMVHAD